VPWKLISDFPANIKNYNANFISVKIYPYYGNSNDLIYSYSERVSGSDELRDFEWDLKPNVTNANVETYYPAPNNFVWSALYRVEIELRNPCLKPKKFSKLVYAGFLTEDNRCF